MGRKIPHREPAGSASIFYDDIPVGDYDGAGLFARPYLESRLDDIRSAVDVVARIELYGHRTLVFVQPCLVYGLEICLVVARIWKYGYGLSAVFLIRVFDHER